jgi:hypothetical protein
MAALNPVIRTLGRVRKDLVAQRVKFALVGGLAVSARGHSRYTGDVDIAVAVGSDKETERLISALIGGGYHVHSLLEHETTLRLATIRLDGPLPATPIVIVDLLFASCGIEPEIVMAADTLEIARGLRMPVARSVHLIAMKVLSQSSARMQDQIDLMNLIRDLSEDELEDAREALRLMTERGFNRDRDLLASLEEFIHRVRSYVDETGLRERRVD